MPRVALEKNQNRLVVDSIMYKAAPAPTDEAQFVSCRRCCLRVFIKSGFGCGHAKTCTASERDDNRDVVWIPNG